ncbi:MAG: cyanophycin synthetase [Candidatus Krumholzibacteriia bacterium]
MISRDRDPMPPTSFPGEPGIGPDLAAPFAAEDEATRWLFALNRKGIRPGLVRVEGLLADLGHPERRLTTLVVGGTNGKGSTTRMLARLLQAAGLRVATYTSPHLLRVYERLQIDDRPVDPAVFAAQVDAVRASVDRHQASWFESLTAVSVQIAAEAQVDVLCAEVGLGGRLDATNALPAAATLLTTVDLDHQHILGATREEILAEKLGLLKPGTPFFSAVAPPFNPQCFEAAIRAGSPAYFLDEITRTELADDRWRLVLRDRVIDGLPRLGSAVMRRNAALALLCLDTLSRDGTLPLPADPGAALADLFLPGRWQTVLTRPDVIVDTGHNAQALLGTLTTFLDRPTRGRRVVVFGGMHDKEVPRELGALLRRCDDVTFTPVSLPRSRTRDDLRALWEFLELPAPAGHSIVDSVAAALAYWGPRLQADDALLVTGSCFLVAEALHRLGVRDLEETRHPRPAATVFGG